MPRSLPVGPVMHDEAEPIYGVGSCPRVLLEEIVWLKLDSLLPDSVRKMLRPVLLSLLEMLRAILQDDLECRVLLVQHPENVQELAPVDGGWHAWRFVASGFVVEVMVWGFQFRSAYNRLHVLLVY